MDPPRSIVTESQRDGRIAEKKREKEREEHGSEDPPLQSRRADGLADTSRGKLQIVPTRVRFLPRAWAIIFRQERQHRLPPGGGSSAWCLKRENNSARVRPPPPGFWRQQTPAL